ncbi:MAG: hypothetical protein Kow0069_10240 [Promethearchaeota archaeon]
MFGLKRELNLRSKKFSGGFIIVGLGCVEILVLDGLTSPGDHQLTHVVQALGAPALVAVVAGVYLQVAIKTERDARQGPC